MPSNGSRTSVTPTILLSPSGRRVELWRLFESAARELGLDWRVMGTDVEPVSATSLAAGPVVVVPSAASSDFIPTMEALVHELDVRLVVPTIDPELPVYAASSLRSRVAISTAEAVTIAADKLACARWASTAGIAAPGTWTLAEAADLPRGSYAIKPRFGSAARGVQLGLSAEEVAICRERGTAGEEYLVQELLRGPEYTVNCFVTRSGRCVATIPHRRLRVRSGEVSRGITVHHAGVEAAAQTAMSALPGAYGALCAQFIDDADRGPCLVEINARFGGGYPLAHRAGARFPERLLRDAAGLARPEDEAPDVWEAGWEMFRYDESVFHRPA